MAGVSPMMRQYLDIKREHPDNILMFRLGDFYEMFFDDAVTASRELELVLTGRDCGQEERAPMCGVPFHSVDGYIAKLIKKGYKVAICEQTEDPALAKGIVKREVVRVITPGTVIEGSMLDEAKNNYIGSVYATEDGFGLCFADVSTGDVLATQISGTEEYKVIDELARFSPSELLVNSKIRSRVGILKYINDYVGSSVESADEYCKNSGAGREAVLRQFHEKELSGLGMAEESAVFFAVAGLISYVNDTQRGSSQQLITLRMYERSDYMNIGPSARRSLELTETIMGRDRRGTLLWVLDRTETSMGRRMLRSFMDQPLVSVNAINGRLDAVEELCADNVLRSKLKNLLSDVSDMERIITRISCGAANPREVLTLATTAEVLPQIVETISRLRSREISALRTDIDTLQDVKNLIESALVDEPPIGIRDGGIIRSEFSDEIRELREISTNGKSYLTSLEMRLKNETGIHNLKIGYNRVFGYYIEVSKSNMALVPDIFIRKQTLANGERYITDELKDLEGRILGANERLIALERRYFEELREKISFEISRIQRTAGALARLDVYASFAETAVRNRYCRPAVDEGDSIEILEGRHPSVELLLDGSPFVPNDTMLNTSSDRINLITGPNMAGKSTYMRQTALIVLMAQMGSFVPAKWAKIGVADSVFTRVGSADDLAGGRSTFLVEMNEVAEILGSAGKRSLVILDEIGRGTSTYDGMSIARAVIEHISKIGCRTMFATHYHELTELENELDGVKNYSIAAKKRGDGITFLRRIVRGPADDSYGIEVAKLAGLPEEVVERAKRILSAIEGEARAPRDQLLIEDFAKDNVETINLLSRKLEDVDPETLTPIEALNLLYELKKVIRD